MEKTNNEQNEFSLDLRKFVVPDEKGNLCRVKFVEGDERNQYLDCIDEPHKPLTKNDLIALYGFSLDADAVKAAREVSANFAEVNESQKMNFGYSVPWHPRFYAKAFGPIEWKVAKTTNEKVANTKETIDLYRVGVVSDGLNKSEEERNEYVNDWWKHKNFAFTEAQVNGDGWKWQRDKLGLKNMNELSKFVQQMPDRQADKQQADLGMER